MEKYVKLVRELLKKSFYFCSSWYGERQLREMSARSLKLENSPIQVGITQGSLEPTAILGITQEKTSLKAIHGK